MSGAVAAKVAGVLPPRVIAYLADDLAMLDTLVDKGHCTVDEAADAVRRALELTDAVERGELSEEQGEQLMQQFALAQTGEVGSQ